MAGTSAKKNRKRAINRTAAVELPVVKYPKSPHVIGADWIELRVSRPAVTKLRWTALGFSPRGHLGRDWLLGIGGVVFRLVKSNGTGKSGRTRTTHGLTLQLAVDQVQMKWQQLHAMGLGPSAITRQKRGDATFTWTDEDGHTLRFVGPVRKPEDPRLD